jgi:hypothetical protein
MAVVAVGGCGLPAEADGFADRQAQLRWERERVHERLAALDSFVAEHNWMLGGEWSVSANMYTLVTVNGEATSGVIAKLAMMGSPAEVSTEPDNGIEGSTLFTYHPAGSEWDYDLLGENLRDLAPTPWVAEPTLYYDSPTEQDDRRMPYGMPFCAASSFALLCGVRASVFWALTIAEAEADSEASDPSDESDAAGCDTSTGAPAKIERGLWPQVTTLADGTTELRLTVPFNCLATSSVFPNYPSMFTDSALDPVLSEIGGQPVSLLLWQTAQGEPVKVEVNGTLTAGEDVVQVQAGWESLGEATNEDFPELPSALDVTYLDVDEAAAFGEAVQARRRELREQGNG